MDLSRRRFTTSLTALAGLAATPALAQRRQPPVSFPLFDTPPSSHALAQFDVTADGLGYRLFIAAPRGAPPSGGWPSLWMLDGNAAFSRLSAAQLTAHPRLAVVGIGYPIEEGFDGAARARDYTPTPLETPKHGRGRDWEFGGQAAFRARLLGPLAAALAAHAPLDPARRCLWGHSYGGVFALATLLSAPEAFRAYMPISPSTGFGGGALQAMAAGAPQLERGRAEVLMMLGDNEHRSGTPDLPEPRPNPDTMAMAERLAQRPDLHVQLEVLKGLGHGATFAASFPRSFALAEA
ncbi:alpha/beta hydrolase [Alloyangia pacifica]|uniref:alpha/beta hydrolase n=1 Tax=Alloyangia pacifica TaxID=311180 RepID=UPI001CD33FA9|nr:alpha/beta hydrolase-fold protein [Alloyangia pacifica]MCA0997049.1 prolyl oligopeptidase family serine peptidase [Alloyangia pacifica]